MAIRIALIENDAVISGEAQQVLARDAECTCVAVCRTLRSAQRRIPELRPDVVIVEVQFADGSGFDALIHLKRLLPQTEFVVFTAADDSGSIFRALAAGASGYLLKAEGSTVLAPAVHEVMAGGVPMSASVARTVIRHFQRPAAMKDPLTPREEEVLQFLAKGLRSREIARSLEISLETVHTHLKHIYGKLHVRTRTEAVIKYLQ